METWSRFGTPTRFGTVGCTIRPAADWKSIDAEILPPASATGLGKIVLRVRHPEGKPIRAVTVSEIPHAEFSVEAQTISPRLSTTPLTVHIDY